MNLSYSEIVTSFTIWEFLSELTKSYSQMDIYKAGIIDSRGNFLKDPEDYKTDKERRAGNTFNRLIVVLKRALLTSSDPLIRYTATNPMAALNALAEEVDSLGGDGNVFLQYTTPLFEDGAAAPVANSVAAGGIYGARGNTDEVVVSPAAAKRHKKRAKLQSTVGRKLFEQILNEAKKSDRIVQTTGHMTHLGDWMYYGDPDLPIKHLEAAHARFQGKTTPEHAMSLKADGGMSVVLKRHKDGSHAVAYKSGAEEFKTPEQIQASGKPHYIRELIPALDLAKKSNLKPGTAVQGDILFSSGHQGIVQPNAIRYSAPHANIGFAAHSQYETDGLNLKKQSSHPEPLKAEGAFTPDLAIRDTTKLSITPARHKTVSDSISQAKTILADKNVRRVLKGISLNKKFHTMFQEYSNEAARTSGERSVKGLMEFIPVHMAKASQKNLSQRTKDDMVRKFTRRISANTPHFESIFKAHGHINTAKHALLDQFKEHSDQFALKTHGGEEHEGFVSSLGKPGVNETQAKFVREGPGGFPEKNVANAAKRFGKPT